MDDILELDPEEQALYFRQAAANLGFAPAVVEKDFWVCWTLRVLFCLPTWGEHFLFKGGTSLSKGWKLIHRFSEDIDIAVSREKLGYPGDHSLTNKQLKRLRKSCQEAVQGEIARMLLEASSGVKLLDLCVDEADPDGQTLLLGYPSSFSPEEKYIRPAVKIEMGARSDTWPSDEIVIDTLLYEALPNVVNESLVRIRALSPLRTFWEKAMLLHEERSRPEDKKRKSRMARHYYDLWCLIQAGIGDLAANDLGLFESVADHRRVFFRQSWVDYNSLSKGGIKIVPPDAQMPSWEEDYEAMHSLFFPGATVPAWREIIDSVAGFEKRFNQLSLDGSA